MIEARGAKAAPRAAAAALARHPRHALLTALLAGLLCGPRWPEAVAALALAALVAAVAAHPGRAVEAGGRGVPRSGRAVALGGAVAVLAGAVVADVRLAALDGTALSPASDALVRGFVAEAPRTRSFGTRVAPVRLSGGRGAGERVLVRARPHVRWPPVEVGDEVAVRGDLRALAARERFERRRNVHAVVEAERIAATGRSRRSVVDPIRRRAERGVAAGLPAEQGALARGMVLGQDDALPADLRDAFRAAGLAHLVAASGANVMLLAALVLAAATAAGLGLRARLALALAAVALYVPLAGAGPSIQRAGVMGAAGLVAALAGRPASRWYALLLAATATLIVNPRAAEEPGWQLSFAAVVAILGLHGRIRDGLVARGAPAALAEACALTIAATIGTAPLLALHFGELSLVSLPANVLAVPAVAPVMWLGALAGVLGGDAARLPNALAAYPLAYLAWLGRTAAAVPHATVPLVVPGPLAVVAVYAAATAWALRRRAAPAQARPEPRRRSRRTRAAACLATAAGALAFAPGPARPPAGFAISFLDVGQGDATLLQHGEHAVLVDTGPPGAPVVRELRAAGVRRLDALFVTHASADHEGNAAEVMRALPVGLLLDGTGHLHAPPGVPRHDPRAGEALRLGPMELRFLWPPAGVPRSREDPNRTATVAVVRDGATTALLPADAESPVTLPLDLPRIDVLKVAHHGSEDEGLPELLRRLRPAVAVIPVGRNTYGHPVASTVAALRAVPDVLRSDRDGTVRIEPRGGRLEVARQGR